MTSKNKKRKNGNQKHKKLKKWEICVKDEGPKPFLARIIIDGKWNGNLKKARKLLEDICKGWPKGKKVKFLITCGGFIHFEPPEDLPEIGNNRKTNNKAVKLLEEKAEEQCTMILDKRLREKLNKYTHFLTIGVDDSKDMIQLVGLVNLKNNKYHWTGKSFPTPKEENTLILVSNLSTHFVDLDKIGKVMILGCHDLNLLIERGRKTKRVTWRKNRKKKFQELAKRKRPIYILHHPHSTDSTRTWSAAWGAARNLLPTVEKYASAFRYLNGEDGEPRSDLDEVRAKTKLGDTIDFIATTRE